MKREKLIQFYQTYRLYIFPIVVALSSLFLIIFAIYPQTVKLIITQKATDDLINKSKFLETKAAALENYNEEDLSQKVGYALGVFPADKDYGNILTLLQQQVVKSGFSINSISFSNAGNKLGNSQSFEVKLEVKGAKALLQSLLNNLEDSPRLIKVNSIDITFNQISQALDASLLLQVLYSAIPNSFGTADSPLPELSQKDQELLTTLAKTSETSVIFPAQSANQVSPRGKANPFE